MDLNLFLSRLKESEEKLKKETEVRYKVENDFRLLQTDYKRFMNYTDHFNSDYMMKLRHIGNNLLQDCEFESKLDATLENLTRLKLKSYKKLASIENKK